jgi:hypothetical protein
MMLRSTFALAAALSAALWAERTLCPIPSRSARLALSFTTHGGSACETKKR